MELRNLDINIKYIYPETVFIIREINLFRIVDLNIKETIVFYSRMIRNKYEICMLNTSIGNTIGILKVDNTEKFDELIDKIKREEENIKKIKNLSDIENYILKILKN